MRIRTFVGIVFIFNLLVTNICFVSSTYAALPRDDHQTFFSHEVPMSLNVVTCTWVKTDDGWKPTPDSPCASGHCLQKERPETRCTFTVITPEIPTASPLPFPTIALLQHDAPRALLPAVHESPPPYPGIVTTVMRL